MVRPERKALSLEHYVKLFLIEGGFNVELANNVLSKVDVTTPTNYILLLRLRFRGHLQTNSVEN